MLVIEILRGLGFELLTEPHQSESLNHSAIEAREMLFFFIKH